MPEMRRRSEMNIRTEDQDGDNRYEGGKFEIDERIRSIWQGWQDSNPRHAVLETAALPTELHP
jgi:hypothetical protein